MSGSNPFRRKQQTPLDQDAFGPEKDEIVTTGARFPSSDTGRLLLTSAAAPFTFPNKQIEGAQTGIKPITKHVRIISPHSSKLGSESDDGSQREFPSSPTSWESRNESPRSERRSTAPFEDTPLEDPFRAASETEDMNEEDEEVPSPVRKTVRSVPNKARATLGVDSDNPWRTSTLIGNLPNRNVTGGRGLHEDVRTVPAKAQKTLGISREDGRNEDHFRQQTASPPTTQSVPPKAQRTLGIPSNPFQKNVPPRDNNSFDEDGEGRLGVSRNSSTLSMRAPLGVDAFTRLLMTGDIDSSASTPSILPLQGILGDSSSNTDTSSLSRQSIVESQTGSHVETPRTSHESSPEAEELQLSLQRSAGKFSSIPDTSSSPRQYASAAIKTQPAPYARDPVALTSPVELPAEMPATPTRQPASISPKTSTDLNKPLPPPPTSIISATGASLLGLSLTDHKDYAPSTRDPPPRARIAPTPPLARRHSQLRSKQPGAPTGRSAPIAEEILPPSQSTSPAKPPAPPPPRRRNTDRNSLTLDPPNLPELPSTPLKPSPSTEKPRPPIPPARTSSVSKRSLADRSPADRPSASPLSSSAAMAPPPPPRRRGSSASGYSLRRPSSEIAPVAEEESSAPAPATTTTVPHSKPADTISKPAPAASDPAGPRLHIAAATAAVAGPRDIAALQSSADVISKAAAAGGGSGSGNADVLADLSRLQQEVDALRGRYEGGMGWGD
ncbi:hypothetical protein MMC15_008608 [Xylographa vitiligo]|nr:hypothetical protein [Xylographa vitiligo]